MRQATYDPLSASANSALVLVYGSSSLGLQHDIERKATDNLIRMAPKVPHIYFFNKPDFNLSD